MVTILVKEQVIFLVIAENREIPVTIIVTFFGDNIVTKYGDCLLYTSPSPRD